LLRNYDVILIRRHFEVTRSFANIVILTLRRHSHSWSIRRCDVPEPTGRPDPPTNYACDRLL